jgi:prepilin-type N-terminal cleavage/methylation domain-containing protein
MARLARSVRRGYTLVELLVAMLIIGIVAGIGLYFYPTFSDNQRVTTATDQLTGALLIAKQWAKRDGIPTGVRFTLNGTSAGEVRYIQQPDPFAYGRCVAVSGTTLTFSGVNFSDSNEMAGEPNSAEQFVITVGDYIELFGGPVHQINGVATTQLSVSAGASLPTLANNSYVNTGLPNYKIYPGPRVLAGEQPVTLPTNVVVDLSQSNLSPRQVKNVNGKIVASYYDILFSPSGSVLAQSNNDGQIFLTLVDTTQNTTAQPVIVAVQLRTGFIAAHPRASGSDPFAFARDARSSGM